MIPINYEIRFSITIIPIPPPLMPKAKRGGHLPFLGWKIQQSLRIK